MRITANQVTLARLVLLPIPVAMLYLGYFEGDDVMRRAWEIAALVTYVLLGLTDAVDGMLARRYGSTPLGALLDPIVDKIFLVAAFGPLADLRIAPPVLIVVLFAREIGVTALRSVAIEEGFKFRTSRLAKLKTTVQMAGAGFLFLFHTFRDGTSVTVIVTATIVCGLAPMPVQWLRGRRPGWKAKAGTGFIVGIGVFRALFDADVTNVAVMLIVAGMTVYTGAEYAWGMRHVLKRRAARRPVELVRLLAVSCVLPFVFLPVLQRPGAPVWAVLLLLAVELALGGVDNSLVQSGVRRGPWPDLLRAGIQGAIGLALLALLTTEEARALVNDPGANLVIGHVLGAVALAAGAVDLGIRIRRHGRLLAAGA